ncbi:MAG: XdhC family protein [Pyrinomonadaceae bacterium]
MSKEFELWQFIAGRLEQNENVMLLVVAESSGSSPGRQGYKMAVGKDGELCGSIGGGVMEVNLVELAGQILSAPSAVTSSSTSIVKRQIHRKTPDSPSGMICSGEQTVILRLLSSPDAKKIDTIIDAARHRTEAFLTINSKSFNAGPPEGGTQNAPEKLKAYFIFEKESGGDFIFRERLGPNNDLYIIGGGHCALALSEVMSKMDFHLHIFDDRPDLNTISKNRFADDITIIEDYVKIGDLIPSGSNTYVVVMTLGYRSDEIVIRQLIDNDFKYFGVLGSRAKMATLMTSLKKEGFDAGRLDCIRAPIGIPINSRTPEEIAVSIAAEIIAVKNG